MTRQYSDGEMLRLLDALERGPCPECGEHPARHPDVPRWDEDVVVKRLGFSVSDSCPDCGKRWAPTEQETP